jgi:poly(3-hydroxyalkanoate) synthetase
MPPEDKEFPWLWPLTVSMQLGAATVESIGKMLALSAPKDAPAPEEPRWRTPHRVVLDLPALRLHEFSTAPGPPIIIVAPFTLHGPILADLAPGHSLIERLLQGGIAPLMLLECKSAEPRMAFLDIDDYLAQIAVALNEVGGPASLVGLCQGGWLSLMVAARFPSLVSRLVLVGSPIDLDAVPSRISTAARRVTPEALRAIVEDGHGRVLGQRMLGIWDVRTLAESAVSDVLQNPAPSADQLDRFRIWHGWTLDLPGSYYLRVVEELFRQNRLARGEFRALGRILDLKRISAPLYLLAAEDDEVTPAGQVMAAARLVGTPRHDIHTATVPGRHLSLFMGARTLESAWSDIARWLTPPGRGTGAGGTAEASREM